MNKRWVGGILALALAASLSQRVNASEVSGTIRVDLDTGELPAVNGAVTLYHVGVRTEDGYRITDTFGGGMVKEADATSPHLAQWLAETEDIYGKRMLLDTDGDAVFSNLGDGLYLVVQTESTDGFHPIRPYLVALPQGDTWDVQTYPVTRPIVIDEMPQTGQNMVPYVGVAGMLSSAMGLILCFCQRKRFYP